MRASIFRERLPSAAAAIALQVGLFALLAASFEVVHNLPAEKETILHLAPLPQAVPRMPMTIDARGKRKTDTTTPASPSPPADARPAFNAGSPQIAITPQIFSPDTADCAIGPGKTCPPHAGAATASGGNTVERNPPSHVKDEARWQAEMAHRNGPPDAGVTNAMGDIGVTIQDPLCKLAGLLLGGLKCGAPTANHFSTQAQFQAALDAYHQRRGGGPAAALASAASRESGNEKDRNDGAGAGPDLAAVPGSP